MHLASWGLLGVLPTIAKGCKQVPAPPLLFIQQILSVHLLHARNWTGPWGSEVTDRAALTPVGTLACALDAFTSLLSPQQAQEERVVRRPI